ncbi:hypothetical protein HKX48_004662 [Thoreauomyces humboldtii]|nr:hypothetical protein HKX48_004662 [Thoreauomyces humboldtii]
MGGSNHERTLRRRRRSSTRKSIHDKVGGGPGMNEKIRNLDFLLCLAHLMEVSLDMHREPLRGWQFTCHPGQTPTNVVHGLKNIGVPVRVINTTAQFTTYPVVLLYNTFDLAWTPTTADVANIKAYVSAGGNLIAMSQVPSSLSAVFGVTSVYEAQTSSRSGIQFANVESTPVVLKGMNFSDVNDYWMPIWDSALASGLPSVGYVAAFTRPAPTILGTYTRRTNSSSTVNSADTVAARAAFTQFQATGYSGYAYAFGIDLGNYYFRAMSEDTQIGDYYIGMYYPGYDTILRLIKNIYQRGTKFMTLWPTPYNMGLTFITSWDLDTAVAYPQSMALATAALQLGANGNLNMHTKYVSDAYEDAYFQFGVPYIYQITGFLTDGKSLPLIDIGSHSVSHSPNADLFPVGLDSTQYYMATANNGAYHPYIHFCDPNAVDGVPNNGETCVNSNAAGGYWTENGTIYGEVRISKWLLEKLLLESFNTTFSISTYRPGHLAFNRVQSQVADVLGYIGGSSCADNGHSTHLPIHMTHNRQPFAEVDYYEFPLSYSDENGNMSSAWFPGSDLQMQYNRATQIAQYGGLYNILIHPSDLMLDKLQFQNALHNLVRPFSYFANTTGIAWWWRARDQIDVDYTISGTKVTAAVKFAGPTNGITVNVPLNWVVASVSTGYVVCQALSYDKKSMAVVFTTSIAGTATLTLTAGTAAVAAIPTTIACPSFVSTPLTECLAYEVLVAGFMNVYTQNKLVNELILDTESSPNLVTQYTTDQRLQLVTDSGTTSYSTRNYWYTTISQFCLDITPYTHLRFDLVAPAGSDFFIKLQSRDAGCTTDLPSPIYVRASDYTVMDGTNRSVAIPIVDLGVTAPLSVRSIWFTDLYPKNTTFYIDNVMLQKRCITGPGEGLAPGLALDSFSSLGRWISGENSMRGPTAVSNMYHYRLPNLNKLILQPKVNGFYTSAFPTPTDVSAYTHILVQFTGPTSGTFNVTLQSGASGSATATVASGCYSKVVQGVVSQMRVPLTSFPTVDFKNVYGVRIDGFSPYGIQYAYELKHIAFYTPNAAALVKPSCTFGLNGTVVNDFCSPREFVEEWNLLGGSSGDNNTASTYYTTQAGSAVITPAAGGGTYWYANLGSTCYNATAAVGGAVQGVRVVASGPVGGTARIRMVVGTDASCTANITWVNDIFFNSAGLIETIFDVGLNINGLQGPQLLRAIYIDTWPWNGGQYTIDSVSIAPLTSWVRPWSDVKPSSQAGVLTYCPNCGTVGALIIGGPTFCNPNVVPKVNALGGLTDSDGTLAGQSLGANGRLNLLPASSQSYWYTLFGTGACYAAPSNVNAVQFIGQAPAGSSFVLKLRWRPDAACTQTAVAAGVSSDYYVTFPGPVGSSNYPPLTTLTIPFAAFPGLNPATLTSLSLESFSAPLETVSIYCLSLVQSSVAVAGPGGCTFAPASAFLDYCQDPYAGSNSLGGTSSDDGTMAVKPVINGALLTLRPTPGSYWYTTLPCTDVSSYSYVVFSIQLATTSTLTVELQTSSAAGCPTGTASVKVHVDIAPYRPTSSTGGAVDVSIPFTAFTDLDPTLQITAVTGLSLGNFAPADGVTSYNVTRAFWSATAA